MNKNNKKICIVCGAICLLIGIILLLVLIKPGSKNSKKSENIKQETKKETKEEIKEKVDIVDLNSKTRPLAVSVNNTPVAIKVQTGLNKAFLVYEIPTEGLTSRLMALFKSEDDVKVGTIRSARHNFIDFALESDAIFAAYGWSHYAEDQLKSGAVNYVQGLVGEGNMFRENPEKLASEHTAYLNTSKVMDYAVNKKKYSKETSNAKNTILLNYNVSDVDLSKRTDAIDANSVTIPYGSVTTEFRYDSNSKMYTRVVNGTVRKDHETNEDFTTKNIIVERLTYKVCDDNYYWDLNTIGSGEGYYITNGKAVPIKWSKASRNAKTKYTYLDGSEIEVSDGRTYIEVQVTNQKTTIK